MHIYNLQSTGGNNHGTKVNQLFTVSLFLYTGENEAWNKHIHLKVFRWPKQITYLLQEAKFAKRPVYVLMFEDLKADTVREMKKVTDFLGFSFTEQEIAERLGMGFSKFYRNHTADFSHFTAKQESLIHDVVNRTARILKSHGVYYMFPRIDDYL